ncbi:MAG: hypothetical protein M3M96_02705 [Candidatus Eremiobacteraeota bacterium]|nr:hypothetical protein [Candidatus Eremiobacteraeota bacterium]
MGNDNIRDTLNDAKDAVGKGIDNVKDSANQAMHNSTAEAEKTRRDVDGENMTASEKVGSMFNEGKNRTQAEMDAAKKDVRNNT